MATTYPARIDNSQSLPMAVDNFTPITASFINGLRSAIIAIEQSLGTNPAGTYGTVSSALLNLQSIVGSLQIISLSQDLGGTLGSPNVVGLQGRPISNAIPGINQVLSWNGIAWSPTDIVGGDIIFSRDINGTATAQTVIGIQDNPVSSITPLTGQTFVWSGTAWTPGTNFGNQSLYTTGEVVSGPALSTSSTTGLLTVTGKIIANAISTVNISDAGQGIIYFDSTQNQFLVSQNGSAYIALTNPTLTPGSSIGTPLIWDGYAWLAGTNFGNQSLYTTGQLTTGPILSTSETTGFLNVTGKIIANAISTVNISDAGQGIVYFDSTQNKFLMSQNGGSYTPLQPYFNVQDYGAIGDDSTDNHSAIQAAITAASNAGGGVVFFPSGNYVVSSSLTLPYTVSLLGNNYINTKMTFTAATNGIVWSGTAQNVAGKISELSIWSTGSGLVGLTVSNLQGAQVDRCSFVGWTYQGVLWLGTILCDMRDTIVSFCGSLTGGFGGGVGYAAVEVDSLNVNGNLAGPNSTTWNWYNNNITNNITAAAGLRIDRTGPVNIIGGTSENSGIPIQIGSKTETINGTGAILISGLDIEIPVAGTDPFIEMGYGLTGINNSRVVGVIVANNTLVVDSGAIPYGIKCKNTDAFYAYANDIAPDNEIGTTLANFWFDGYTCSAMQLGVNRVTNNDPYVVVNGTTDTSAIANRPWSYTSMAMGGGTFGGAEIILPGAISAPPAPSSGFKLYVDSSSQQLRAKDSTNTVTILAGSQVFNIEAYGAFGNGITDNSTAIQNAINACSAAGGGAVFIPVGNFLFSNTINLPEYVNILGAGIGSILSYSGASIGIVWRANTISNPMVSVIEKVQIRAANSSPQMAIKLIDTYRATIRDCWIDGYTGSTNGFNQCGVMFQGVTVNCGFSNILESSIQNCIGDGIEIIGVTPLLGTFTVANGNPAVTASTNQSLFIVVGCSITFSGSATVFTVSSIDSTGKHIVLTTNFDGSNSSSNTATLSSGLVAACSVQNSQIQGNGGWAVRSICDLVEKAQFHVMNCDLEGNTSGGIYGSFTNSKVFGNYFENAGARFVVATTTGVPYGENQQCLGVMIQNNLVTNYGGGQFAIDYSTGHGANDCIIECNSFPANASGNINVAAISGRIKSNSAATVKVGIYGDGFDTGLNRQTYRFYLHNITSSIGLAVIPLDTAAGVAPTTIAMEQVGTILGVRASCTSAPSAGSYHIEVHTLRGGSLDVNDLNSASAPSSGDPTTQTYSLFPAAIYPTSSGAGVNNVYPFSAGDVLSVKVSTNGSLAFSGTTDLLVEVIVGYGTIGN